MSSLTGKTALITGTSSGIGLAITRHLLQLNCKVIGLARDHAKADIQHENFTPMHIDLSDLENTSELSARICREQHIDFFIHCAGEGLFGSIEQFSVPQIDKNLRTNLTSALVLAHHVVPAMRKNRSGRIIFIGSESSLQAGRKGTVYCSAKFGLRGLALSLREDCSRDGINVTLINPGMVRSPFFDQLDFRPGEHASNAITTTDIAETVAYVLGSNPDIVFDEINLSPRNRSIEFKPKSR